MPIHLHRSFLPVSNRQSPFSQRGEALYELSNIPQECTDLALKLTHSPGVIAILLLEIASTYGLLSEGLSQGGCTRVCAVMRLLQVIADDHRTRSTLLSLYIHMWLYPFFNTTSRERLFEFLRMSALSVIAGLVRQGDRQAVEALLLTGIVPVCLQVCETSATCSSLCASPSSSRSVSCRILLDSRTCSRARRASPRLRACWQSCSTGVRRRRGYRAPSSVLGIYTDYRI